MRVEIVGLNSGRAWLDSQWGGLAILIFDEYNKKNYDVITWKKMKKTFYKKFPCKEMEKKYKVVTKEDPWVSSLVM